MLKLAAALLLLSITSARAADGKVAEVSLGSFDLGQVNVMRGASLLPPLTPTDLAVLQRSGVAGLDELTLHAAATLDARLQDSAHVEDLRRMGMTPAAIAGLHDLSRSATAGRPAAEVEASIEAVESAVPSSKIAERLGELARLDDLGGQLRKIEAADAAPQASLQVLDRFFSKASEKNGYLDSATVFPKLRFADAVDLGSQPDGWLRVAVFKDARTLITGGMDGVIRLSDVKANAPVGELRGHAGVVRALELSPDHHHLYSADDSGMILRWNLRKLDEPPLVLRKSTGQEVRALTLTPDGRSLVSGGQDEVLVWDTRRPDAPRAVLKGQTTYVLAVKDNRSFFAAGDDGAIRLIDLRSGGVLAKLEGHSKAVRALALSPDRRLLVSSAEDKTIRAWDARSGKLLETREVADGWVRSIRFRDARSILTGNINGWVQLLTLSKRGAVTKTKAVFKHDDVVFETIADPTGNLVVSTGRDLRLGIYDIRARKLRQLKGIGGPVHALAFIDDKTFVGIGHDGALWVWPSIDAAPQRIGGHARSGRAVAVTPGGLVATGGDDRRILLRSGTGHPRVLEGHSARVRALAFDPSYTMLASGGDDRELILWDVREGKELTRVQLPPEIDVIHSLAWNPARAEIAVGGRDGRVRIVDVKTGRVAAWPEAHKDYIRSLAYSRDGRLLATVGRDGELWIWNAATGKPVHELSWHQDDVNSVEFDPTSRYILTASDDKSVRLLDLVSGDHSFFYRSERPLSSARFIPGTEKILVIDDQHKIKVLDLSDIFHGERPRN